MSVAENMGICIKDCWASLRKERDRRVKDAAKLLDLEDYLDRKPKSIIRWDNASEFAMG